MILQSDTSRKYPIKSVLHLLLYSRQNLNRRNSILSHRKKEDFENLKHHKITKVSVIVYTDRMGRNVYYM